MSEAVAYTEGEIKGLVHAFYARVRQDPALGPIFEAHIDDWDGHLSKLADFWSSVLLKTGRYSGAPMPKHMALPNLNAGLFERWLGLFRDTTAALDNAALREQADAAAARIAQSLWFGYQMQANRAALPSTLPRG